MFVYDKDMERVMQAKKREILAELEKTKCRLLKELSGVDKVTLTRLREIIADYNRIDFNLNERLNAHEERFNKFIQDGDVFIVDGQNVITQFQNEIARLDEINNEIENLNNALDNLESELKTDIEHITSFTTPQMFGAIGDGETDDTNAFEECFIYAQTKGLNVYIPKGVYIVKNSLNLHSNLKVYGAGVQSTVIKTNSLNEIEQGFINVHNLENIHLYDFSLENVGANIFYGVLVTGNAKNVILERLEISKYGTNIDVSGDKGETDGTIKNIVVRDCILYLASTGYGIVFNQTKNALVENIETYSNHLDGVKLRKKNDTIRIIRGRSYSNGTGESNGNGIDCYAGGNNSTIESFEAFENKGAGIYIKQGELNDENLQVGKITVLNCISHDNTGSGVSITRNSGDVETDLLVDGVFIIGGRFFNNTEDGLSVRGKNISINGVYAFKNAVGGLSCSQVFNFIIANSMFINNGNFVAEYQIRISNTNNATFSSCIVSGGDNVTAKNYSDYEGTQQKNYGMIIGSECDNVFVKEDVIFDCFKSSHPVYIGGDYDNTKRIIIDRIVKNGNPIRNGAFGGIGSKITVIGNDAQHQVFVKVGAGLQDWSIIAPVISNGSGNRPSSPVLGMQYYDESLKKPIWWNGTAWADSTGTAV